MPNKIVASSGLTPYEFRNANVGMTITLDKFVVTGSRVDGVGRLGNANDRSLLDAFNGAFAPGSGLNGQDSFGYGGSPVVLDTFRVTETRTPAAPDNTIDLGGARNSEQRPMGPATIALIDQLQQLPLSQRSQLLDQAASAFDVSGNMQNEFTQVIFGGKNGAQISVGSLLTGDPFYIGDSRNFNSGRVITNYFNNLGVQQTIQNSGLVAILVSHSDSVNTTWLPNNLTSITRTVPVPSVFFNTQNVTVISPNVQPKFDQSRTSYQGAQPVFSSSPGIEVTATRTFIDEVMRRKK